MIIRYYNQEKKKRLEQKYTNQYINFKIQQKNHNKYSPDLNGKKYLLVMACNCDSLTKLKTIKTNLQFLKFQNVDKIIVNTSGLKYGNYISEFCKMQNAKYYEIPNNSYLDFGKWIHTLTKLVNYNDYDYIILTNDSFIIHNQINHFFNLTVKYNVELYGYNDSTQVRYHYQSYLFSLRKDAVQTFINKVTNSNLKISSQIDVINNFELQMTNWFKTHNCFLKIGGSPLNRVNNIFFTNDALYFPLKNLGLLPFTKVKRIL
jgi:hypothetical protein